jgi:heme-degrading monooxygenase HmoA
MAFAVMNVVRGTPEEVGLVAAEVQLLGLDEMYRRDGYRLSRLYLSEDGTEAIMVMEWDSREQFLAYRQSELGQRVVQKVLEWHPKISFYDVLVSHERPRGA